MQVVRCVDDKSKSYNFVLDVYCISTYNFSVSFFFLISVIGTNNYKIDDAVIAINDLGSKNVSNFIEQQKNRIYIQEILYEGIHIPAADRSNIKILLTDIISGFISYLRPVLLKIFILFYMKSHYLYLRHVLSSELLELKKYFVTKTICNNVRIGSRLG